MHKNEKPDHDQPIDSQGAAPPDTLALLHLNDGGIVLYDPADHLAWIRTDSPVQVAAME